MTEPSSRYFVISKTKGLRQASNLADALQQRGPDSYLWLDYGDPTAQSLAELMETFQIHPLSIEDCLNENQFPKLDLFPNYSFMIFNTFEAGPEELLTHELDLFLGADFLITVGSTNHVKQPPLQGLEQVITREIASVAMGPSFLMHQVLDMIVDHKFEAVETIEEKLDAYESKILKYPKDFDLSSLMDSRRDLQTIRRSLFHERELLGKLIRGDSPFVAEFSLVYFRDVYDHLSKYYEMSESAREEVTNLMEIHLSLLNNQMAQSANHTNHIMRRLTLLTTIFMPLTLISGIGGMSEFTMMIGQENWRRGYIILLLGMVVIALINYLLLFRMEKKIAKDE